MLFAVSMEFTKDIFIVLEVWIPDFTFVVA